MGEGGGEPRGCGWSIHSPKISPWFVPTVGSVLMIEPQLRSSVALLARKGLRISSAWTHARLEVGSPSPEWHWARGTLGFSLVLGHPLGKATVGPRETEVEVPHASGE